MNLLSVITIAMLLLSGCAAPIYVCHKEPPKWAEAPSDGGFGLPYMESDYIQICEPKIKCVKEEK